MKIIIQLLLFLIIAIVSNYAVTLFPFPFAASILAIIILFILLITKIVKIAQIEKVANFFLNHISLLFIAPVVDIVNHYTHFGSAIIIKFIIAASAATIFTFLATAYSVKLTLYLINKRNQVDG